MLINFIPLTLYVDEKIGTQEVTCFRQNKFRTDKRTSDDK